MKEYRIERFNLNTYSKTTVQNSLNLAAEDEWELVCVSDGWIYYERERKVSAETPQQETA